MVDLRKRLRDNVPKWYSRDLFWEELQILRKCDNEDDYTDEEWFSALWALHERLGKSERLRCT